MITTRPIRETAYEIDLTGPQGNAYYVMGVARNIMKQINREIPGRYDSEAIMAEMTSGDYENLLSVMEKHFGDYVTMYR